jgi:iron complex outermembrane receptor protein
VDLPRGRGHPVEHHFNAFAQEQARVGPVTAIAALRLDRHPLVPLRHTFAPRGALVARVAERTAVRGSVGTSYRVPSQMESYVDLNQLTDFDAVYVRTRGDRSLLPERVLNAELGVHDESSAVHRADVAVFYNRVSDLIYVTDVVPEVRFYDPAQNGFAAGTTRFGNLDPVYDAVGAEADAALFPVDGLDLFANAAVQRVTEDFGGRSVVDGSAPLLRLNGGAAWRSPGPFDLSAQVHYVSAQTWRLREFDEAGALVVREEAVPARTLASVRLGARLLEDDALELSFTAWNLLALAQGEGFREHPKGQLVGPRLTGGATWRF